jgi:phosphoserine phosphatase RsbU/P
MSKTQQLEFKLASLLEITKAINSNTKTPDLLKIYESILRYQLNVGKFVLYMNDNGWKTILQFGISVVFTPAEAESYLSAIKDITLLNLSTSAYNSSPLQKALQKNNVDVVIPVFHKDKALAYALIGDLDEEQIGMGASVKHLNFIQTITNILVVAIENKRLAKEGIRQAEMKKELEVASQMQQMLFPASLPHDQQMEMDAYYIAHQQIGGDYYDFVRINSTEAALCMADVSGKGVSAALLMSNFQANMRILLHRSQSLTELVNELNKKVNETAQGERFITFFVAKYNTQTKRLTYINAGHNPPLLLKPDNSVELLKIGTTGLGMLEELVSVEQGELTIEAGSVLFCYTDGVVEQENENSQEFGVNRIKEILMRNGKTSSIKEINNEVIKSVTEHKGSINYVDDIALLSCRYL